MGEPLPTCFLNGDYLPLREARISPLDRGFLYADGCYVPTGADVVARAVKEKCSPSVSAKKKPRL